MGKVAETEIVFQDLAISWQLFIWAIASSILAFLWFKLLKPLMADRTKAGISREAILGESGQVIRIPEQDNAVIIANAVAYINIISPEKSVYGVEDYRLAIQNLVQTSLRSIIGEMDLDDALSSRDEIKARLKAAISDDIADWGITIKTVEIQDINPSETMQKAMEEQAAAERGRRATVTRADGEKAAAILEAEGRLEASKRDAQAKVVLAEVSLDLDIIVAAENIEVVCKTIEAYFKVERFAHSVNLSSDKSDLRIQLQTDPRYQDFISRATSHTVLGYKMKVASVKDVLQGKIWDYSDKQRRKSKRQKDLADIVRLMEVYPSLTDLIPASIKERIE